MKGLLASVVGVALLLVGSALAEDKKMTHEELLQAMLKNVDAQTACLAKMKDVDAAKAGLADFQKLADEFAGLNKMQQTLGEPAKELDEKLKKQYEPQLTASMGKYMTELMRIAGNKDIATVLEPALNKMKPAATKDGAAKPE